jgi:hypothetical protein
MSGLGKRNEKGSYFGMLRINFVSAKHVGLVEFTKWNRAEKRHVILLMRAMEFLELAIHVSSLAF